MGKPSLAQMLDQSSLLFPPEWVKAALVLAFMSVWLVIALFAYLNRHTKKPYFSLWTVAWMFYAVYLAASIGLEETPDTTFLIMARRACIGISALFMFWGSFHLTNCRRDQRELGFGVVMILIWSYLAAYRVRDQLWITAPVFILLAAAGVYTGLLYWRHRQRDRGAHILGIGFLLWGIHLLAFPFVGTSPALVAITYLVSTVVSLLIVVGMVVEQEVTVSEENYGVLFDSASDAICLLDSKTLRVLEANQSAQRLTNRGTAELTSLCFWDLCPGLRDGTGTAPDAARLVATLNQPCAEFHVARPDGAVICCEARANLVDCPRGPVLQINVRDITERKRAEQDLRETNARLERALTELRRTQQQVIQQERLSALGEMASGVAHDFNNALAKILGFVELLLGTPEHLESSERVKQYLQMMNTAGQDAANVVRRLREFYRKRNDAEVFQPVQLSRLVEQAVALTQPKWKNQAQATGLRIDVRTVLENVPAIGGNEADLREVLTNLVFNAVDAMPAGGTITIRTRRDGELVALDISDTGTGMTDEVRQRCLEPFYSTKGERGTGLGLAIVYGIVQRHGGTIDIDSAQGRGTTFAIKFPVYAGQHVEVSHCEPSRVPLLRILLVEDQPLLREIEAEYLGTDGHVVEGAADGLEGLQKFRAGTFDLVITDQAMPEMSGDKLAAAIKRLSPKTPVILVTGFGDMMKACGDNPAGVDLVLAKPITQACLRQAITTVTKGLQCGQGTHGAPTPVRGREKKEEPLVVYSLL